MIDYDKKFMEFAKVLGDPVGYQLPLLPVLSEVAELEVANPDEDVWRFSALDTDTDCILAINTSTGASTPLKISPVGSTALSFSPYASEARYLLIHDMLNTKDVNKLARTRAQFARSMDKMEAKLIFDAIFAKTGSYVPGTNVQEHTYVSGDDLYDTFIKMKQLAEDWGDDFVLLLGGTLWSKYVKYDKDKSASLNYNVEIDRMLSREKIKPYKVSANVKLSTTSGGAESAIFSATKMILIARKSIVENRKPITIVRRQFVEPIVNDSGVEVMENRQRALIKVPALVNNSGTPVIGYGLQAYEDLAACITNPYAIVFCDATGTPLVT